MRHVIFSGFFWDAGVKNDETACSVHTSQLSIAGRVSFQKTLTRYR